MRILIHKELFRVSNELFMISLNLVNQNIHLILEKNIRYTLNQIISV